MHKLFQGMSCTWNNNTEKLHVYIAIIDFILKNIAQSWIDNILRNIWFTSHLYLLLVGAQAGGTERPKQSTSFCHCMCESSQDITARIMLLIYPCNISDFFLNCSISKCLYWMFIYRKLYMCMTHSSGQ